MLHGEAGAYAQDLLLTPKLDQHNVRWSDQFARFHTNSNVTPAGVRGLVNLISSAVMEVMMRR